MTTSHALADQALGDHPSSAPVWERPVIVAVLLAAALLVPLSVLGNRMSLALVALPFLFALAFFFVRWPSLGFPCMVVASLLVPFSVGTGTQSGINISIILVALLGGLWLFDMIAGVRQIELVPSSTTTPLLAMMGVSLLAFGFGQIRWLPVRPVSFQAQMGGLMIFILSPVAFLLTANQLRDIRSLKWMTGLFVGLGGIFVAGMLVPTLRVRSLDLFQRAVQDAMFWTWIVAISASQSLMNSKLRIRWRIALGLVALGAFYFTIVLRQSWTSGWLPAMVAIMVIALVRKPRWVVGAMVLAVFFAILQPSFFQNLFLGGDNEYSLTTRLEAWRILIQIIGLNPVLGLGPANYYAMTPLFNILGYSVNFNSHNNYIDIVAQIGLVGLVCFLWFGWALLKTIWRLKDQMPDGFSHAFIYGALGGVVATFFAGLFGDWVLPFVYNVGLEGFRASSLAWIFMGSVIALEQIQARSVSAEPELKADSLLPELRVTTTAQSWQLRRLAKKLRGE